MYNLLQKKNEPKSFSNSLSLQKKSSDSLDLSMNKERSLMQGETSNLRLNYTGIPSQTKEKFEKNSGFSFDDVRVHYNSDKPIQYKALAYTQGNQVYVAPGQESHLNHELIHVIQQKQGRVCADSKMNGISTNVNLDLEAEAKSGIVPIKSSNSSAKFSCQPIQMVPKEELSCIKDKIKNLNDVGLIPDSGFNMIKLFFNELNCELHLIGTEHGTHITDLEKGKEAYEFLTSTKYTKIYSELGETEEELNKIVLPESIHKDIDIAKQKITINDVKNKKFTRDEFIVYRRFIEDLDRSSITKTALDPLYEKISASHSNLKSILPLENQEVRTQCAETNKKDLGEDKVLTAEDVNKLSLEESEYIKSGSLKKISLKLIESMEKGIDHQDVEERNKMWVNRMKINEGEKQLWIVGASHLPGIMVRLMANGWIYSDTQEIKPAIKKTSSIINLEECFDSLKK